MRTMTKYDVIDNWDISLTNGGMVSRCGQG